MWLMGVADCGTSCATVRIPHIPHSLRSRMCQSSLTETIAPPEAEGFKKKCFLVTPARNIAFFPTCQVKVARFYVSCRASPSPSPSRSAPLLSSPPLLLSSSLLSSSPPLSSLLSPFSSLLSPLSSPLLSSPRLASPLLSSPLLTFCLAYLLTFFLEFYLQVRRGTLPAEARS